MNEKKSRKRERESWRWSEIHSTVYKSPKCLYGERERDVPLWSTGKTYFFPCLDIRKQIYHSNLCILFFPPPYIFSPIFIEFDFNNISFVNIKISNKFQKMNLLSENYLLIVERKKKSSVCYSDNERKLFFPKISTRIFLSKFQ